MTSGAFPAEQVDALGVSRKRTVHLLPAFDPYTVGSLPQLDRVVTGPNKAKVSRPQGWISPTLVVDGRIDGVWEDGTVTPFGPLAGTVRSALARRQLAVRQG